MTGILLRRLIRNIVPFFFTSVVILESHFGFPQDEIRIFLSFMTLIPVFILIKADFGPVECSIGLLIISAVQLANNSVDNANQLAIYSYWLLMAGVITYCINHLLYRYGKTVSYANKSLHK